MLQTVTCGLDFKVTIVNLFVNEKMTHLEKKQGRFHHGNLEEALIGAGIDIISQSGGTNFSLREVSQSLGVSHAAAYRHFSSKADLLVKIAIRGFKMLTENLRNISDKADIRQNPYKLILALGDAYISFGLQNPGIYRALFTKEVAEGHSIEELNIVSLESWQPLVDAIILGQAERKIISTANPYDIASMLWASLHGYVMLCLEINLGGEQTMECTPNLPKAKFLDMIHQSIWKKS